MASIDIQGLDKTYGAIPALRAIELHVADGECVALLGPSGCGKTTLLRAIAGLERIDRGELLIGGRCVNALPPAQRGVAVVFQSYALYPHMTVYENMAFGLRCSGHARDVVRRRVQRAAGILELESQLDRRPRDLSGGQCQRVAIGRAIVREPEAFLFDEPLSNLDATMRVQMRVEFAQLRRRLAATMLYVTHDQVEAMILADRIAVMRGGRVEQIGTPQQLYTSPDNRFVAEFVGTPRMNFIDATYLGRGDDDSAALRIDASGVPLRVRCRDPGLRRGQQVSVGVRAEELHVLDAPEADADNVLEAEVMLVEYLGDTALCHLRHAGRLPLMLKCAIAPAYGSALRIGFAADGALLFDADGRACR